MTEHYTGYNSHQKEKGLVCELHDDNPCCITDLSQKISFADSCSRRQGFSCLWVSVALEIQLFNITAHQSTGRLEFAGFLAGQR